MRLLLTECPTPVKNVRRHDKQARTRQINHEGEVLRIFGSQRPAIGLVAVKVRWQVGLADHRLNACHHCPAQCTREYSYVHSVTKPPLNPEGIYAMINLGHHHAKPEETTVTQNDWATHLPIKFHLDVPQGLFGKASSCGKTLGPRTMHIEWLPLDLYSNR